MRHVGSLRMYESVLRQLAARGHEILILATRRDSLGAEAPPQEILADVPQIRWIWEDARANVWTELAATIRIWLDYLRYFEPRYADAPRLRTRVGERVPLLLRRVSALPLVRSDGGLRLLRGLLRGMERALPRQRELDDLMKANQPDIALLTPLLHLGSSQVEVLRSARAMGVRTALCVASWDHLSSKARIAELPDRVFLWNDTQKWEATALHGVPAERVTITGAQCYDQWFGRRPVRTREQFCEMLKLPADRPLLLYACSALYPHTPTEARFVRRWIEEIRASDDPLLRSAGILVRPHPTRREEWGEVDLSDLPGVTLYGSLPLDERSKEDYFESLHYSAAVVGLNTSAFLEGAIVGRPVHTIVDPEFRERQEGTLHFHYLKTVGGGVLRLARSFDEHRAQLSASLREGEQPARNDAFVRAFIRPFGVERPATEILVNAVEDLGAAPAAAPQRAPLWAPLARAAMLPLGFAAHLAVTRTASPTDRTLVELQQARRKHQRQQQREAEEQRRAAARIEKARQAAAAREAEQRARRERLDAAQREKVERKAAMRAAKERAKETRVRAKRRANTVAQLKRRIGIGVKPTR